MAAVWQPDPLMLAHWAHGHALILVAAAWYRRRSATWRQAAARTGGNPSVLHTLLAKHTMDCATSPGLWLCGCASGVGGFSRRPISSAASTSVFFAGP